MLSCDSWMDVTVFVSLELVSFLTRHSGAPSWSWHGAITLHILTLDNKLIIYLWLLGKTRMLEISQVNMFKGGMGLRGFGQPA